LRAGNNFALAIECDSSAKGERVFAALANGGKIGCRAKMGANSGMLTDQFGIQWMDSP